MTYPSELLDLLRKWRRQQRALHSQQASLAAGDVIQKAMAADRSARRDQLEECISQVCEAIQLDPNYIEEP